MHHNHTPEIHEHADDWHHHGAEEGLPQEEHTGAISASVLTKWFVLITVSVIAFVVVVQTYFGGYISNFRREREERPLGLEASRAKSAAGVTLSLDPAQPAFYDWTDASAGQVQIPISKGMERVIARYAERK